MPALPRRHRVLSGASSTCASQALRVYSEDYSAYAGCASARPPGADTRRPPPPPPWRGSSLFPEPFRWPDRWGSPAKLRNPIFDVRVGTRSIHSCGAVHRLLKWLWPPVGSHQHSGLMKAGNGVLAMVAETAMRDAVDRVAAAAGVAVVHVAHPPNRQAWTGASAVLLDGAGAARCSGNRLPRRGSRRDARRRRAGRGRLAEGGRRRRCARDDAARRRGKTCRSPVGGRRVRQ